MPNSSVNNNKGNNPKKSSIRINESKDKKSDGRLPKPTPPPPPQKKSQ